MADTVVITGVGPGLGASLAHKFASNGCQVAMLARSTEVTEELAAQIASKGGRALAIAADVSKQEDVVEAFRRVRAELGAVDILINHASSSLGDGLANTSPEDFETSWRIACYGSFLCAKEAVADMLADGKGCILFTGATSSVRGGRAMAFSSAKFAVRGMAQSLARELWPQGIHVAHIIVDGVINTPRYRKHNPEWESDVLLDPDAMAQAYWELSQQDARAWTLELDLRPNREEFFV
ncbi:MAG: SDR family NAD(P)-dependent oxidoreductase [Armatimonadetes bacterium]|nr:SDR family NAD(P)-dependent oxidoreductase [Armatimonadota bacterium]